MDHEQFKSEVRMPQLTADLIDDFVTWLTEQGYDLYSFQLSDVSYKRMLFQKFWNQIDPDQQQFKMHFS
ncbi:MAG: hypothetical protein ACI9J3_001160 [Parvicellaceae bacterium]|jgi:hypothetical protein